MKRANIEEPLSVQVKKKVAKPTEEEDDKNPGNFELMTSTGSTLLNLNISGNRVRGGGLPAGVVVEAFGPSQSGKTVFLSELAGTIQRNGGEAQFHDPESRLDQEFASLFGMQLPKTNYYISDTVTQVFEQVKKWKPKNINITNGIFADSLAALSTKLEMESKDGDKMGMRRAKEFSEQLRVTCRLIKQRNILMVCSNQIRINTDPNAFAAKYVTPGGEAFKFYSSIRLKFNNPEKIYKTIEFRGDEDRKIKNVIGIETEIEVVKTVDSPYRKAPLIIIYGYGIDDIRANLQYCKQFKAYSTYCLNGNNLDKSIEKAIRIIEADPKLILELQNETIDLWEEIRDTFATERIKIR